MTRTRVELAVDAGVVLVAVVVNGMPFQLTASAFRAPWDLVMFCLLTSTALALWFRRRAPELVAWIVVVPVALAFVGLAFFPAAMQGAGLNEDGSLLTAPVPFAAYSLMVYADRTRARWGPLAALATLCVASAVAVEALNPLASMGQAVAMIGAPAALGLYVAARRRLLVALRERAERAERERELLANQAIADERARLAAEIHDIVTHHVSLMVLRAGALGVESADGATRRAAEELRVTGCRALDELRDLVRVLNDPPRPDRGPLEPVPDLSVLIDASESAGVSVTAVSRGLARPVSPAVGRTVYRVVQEALTNVHRHAAGSRVDLALDYGVDDVRVNVRNSAPSSTASAALPSGAGTGLLGLERRIQLLDGTFRASPVDGGGFEVDAVLPAAVRSAS